VRAQTWSTKPNFASLILSEDVAFMDKDAIFYIQNKTKWTSRIMNKNGEK
jgi:hypothetical protein